MAKNRTLANYNKNRAIIKGRFFEMTLKELLVKAGFSDDFESKQITKNRRRLHGRGATYDADYYGVFRLGIPFINPLMIVVEAKNYNKKVDIATAREFLGAYIDFSQWARVDTKAGGDKRYSVLYSPRFTYCPVFFSIKGFQKPAEGFMFAHGINYVSYENSEIVAEIFKHIEDVLDKINFAQFKNEDFKNFHSIEALSNIRSNLRAEGYSNSLDSLNNYLKKISSLIGVLDGRYPVSILYKNKVSVSRNRPVKIIQRNEGKYFLENTGNRKFGEFSLSKNFLKEYIQYAKKNEILDKIFHSVDIVFADKDAIEIRKFKISSNSRNDLIQQLTGDAINVTTT